MAAARPLRTVAAGLPTFSVVHVDPGERSALGKEEVVEKTLSRAILILGREPPAEETLREAELFDELFVVECAVPSPEDEYVIDEERAHADARRRLQTVLARLHRDGVAAAGIVGDPDENAAEHDAVALYPYAGVVLHDRARLGD